MSKKSFGGQETLLSMLRESSINNKERNTSISGEKELQKIEKKEEKNENKNKEKEKEEEKNKKKENEADIFNEDNIDPKHKKQNEIIEKINEFFESLDKEIKKIYLFFSSNEKSIYQNISKKLQNKENIKKKSVTDIFKEIDSINYLSELCTQIIIFIYWNIKALKNILNNFDNSTKEILNKLSYKNVKKFL